MGFWSVFLCAWCCGYTRGQYLAFSKAWWSCLHYLCAASGRLFVSNNDSTYVTTARTCSWQHLRPIETVARASRDARQCSNVNDSHCLHRLHTLSIPHSRVFLSNHAVFSTATVGGNYTWQKGPYSSHSLAYSSQSRRRLYAVDLWK